MLKGGVLKLNPIYRIMIYAVIGVLFITEFVLSGSMDCTKLTTACPTAAEWPDRSNSFNCSGYKRYVCLIAPKAELREGCIFDSFIPAGRVGCPYTDQCANRTGTPLLVMEQNYLWCPPDLYGCPSYNHSGYSILEIYKYPMCQGRSIPEKSSVPNITIETMTAIRPARIPRDGNLTMIIVCVILWVIVASTTIILVIFRKEIKGLGNWDSQEVPQSSCSSNDSVTSQVPLLKGASKKPKLKFFRRDWNSSSQTSHEECSNPAVTNPS